MTMSTPAADQSISAGFEARENVTLFSSIDIASPLVLTTPGYLPCTVSNSKRWAAVVKSAFRSLT